MIFYTKPENIPENDPHWKQITILNMEEFLEKKKNNSIDGENDATNSGSV
jgi:hypothetical protein